MVVSAAIKGERIPCDRVGNARATSLLCRSDVLVGLLEGGVADNAVTVTQRTGRWDISMNLGL